MFETLFASSVDKKAFIESYQPQISKLPVFAQIHAKYDEERAEEARLAQETSVSDLSEIELSPEMFRCLSSPDKEGKSSLNLSNSSSFLNTTQDS